MRLVYFEKETIRLGPKRTPRDAAQRLAQAIARKYGLGVANLFVQGAEEAAKSVSVSSLSGKISSGDLFGAENEVDLEELAAEITRAAPELASAMREAGFGATDELPSSMEGLVFDPLRANVEEWARLRAAELVVEVTDDQRQGLREYLTRAIESEIHPRRSAKQLRNMVGLNSRWQRAVERRHALLLEEGLPADVVERRSEKYAGKLLRRRALTIARTETMRAVGAGRQAMWEQLAQDGAVAAADEKEWQTSMDERVCPYCGPMHGRRVGVKEAFQTMLGSVMNPNEIHPNCMCTAHLVTR